MKREFDSQLIKELWAKYNCKLPLDHRLWSGWKEGQSVVGILKRIDADRYGKNIFILSLQEENGKSNKNSYGRKIVIYSCGGPS